MTNRQYYIDWIRVVAFIILILFHTGMFFNSWGWHVKNNSTISWLDYIMLFFNQWRIPLLFFISGTGVSFALKTRKTGEFIWERTKRLFIPLLLGMFVIVPPQIYFERLQGEQFFGSFLQFYPKVLEFISYPAGNFSWHHLWFLPYLFVYCLILVPFFLWLRKEKGKKFISRLSNLTIKPYSIFLYSIPFMVVYWILSLSFPVTHNFISDWYNHAFSILLFMFGYVLGTQITTWNMLENMRKKYLLISITLSIILYLFFWTDLISIGMNPIVTLILYGTLKMLNIWAIILTFCGYFKHYLNKSNKFIIYATEAILPFYILHQTITVSIGYYLTDMLIPVWIKFLILLLFTFLGSWIIYHFIIKPFNIIRFLFGVKLVKSVHSYKINLKPILGFLGSIVAIYFTFNFFVWAKPISVVIQIPQVKYQPQIMNKTNDSIWADAIVFEDFKTLHPRSGLNPSERTNFFLTYDSNYIYAKFQCFDSQPEKIRAIATNKDNIRDDDWIAFCLDTYSGSKGGYFFITNPNGLQFQGTLNANDGNTNFDTNFMWTSFANINKTGWIAELKIPFNQLPFDRKENVIMRFKAARNISRLSEEDNFPEMNSNIPYHVTRLQKVLFKKIGNSK